MYEEEKLSKHNVVQYCLFLCFFIWLIPNITIGDEDARMSLLSLQPPVAFLDCPGKPKTPFDAWEKLFQNYLLAIGGEEFSA